jgi:hypothetical protein
MPRSGNDSTYLLRDPGRPRRYTVWSGRSASGQDPARLQRRYLHKARRGRKRCTCMAWSDGQPTSGSACRDGRGRAARNRRRERLPGGRGHRGGNTGVGHVRWRPAASGSARAVSAARSAGHRQGGQPPSGLVSRSARMPGSPSATSTILVRPDAPATSVTAPRRTPNAAATAASAASVALPSTALALTRTIRAPACPPPTAGRAEPGRTRMVIRTYQVCGQSRDVPDDHGSEQIPASRDAR